MSDVYAASRSAESLSSSRQAVRAHAPQSSPFVPLLLMGLALLAWTAFQTFELLQDRGNLNGTYAAQQAPIKSSQQLRASLSAIAGDTQKLADAGDPGAKLIVSQLSQRGITIHPGASEPTPP
jgi:hypothetical protein